MVREDESLQVPIPLLPGEAPEFLGRTTDGVIALSNYRLLITFKASFVNVPIGMIDSVERTDIFFLNIFCKDATVARLGIEEIIMYLRAYIERKRPIHSHTHTHMMHTYTQR